jgi:hypothetical protein
VCILLDVFGFLVATLQHQNPLVSNQPKLLFLAK